MVGEVEEKGARKDEDPEKGEEAAMGQKELRWERRRSREKTPRR